MKTPGAVVCGPLCATSSLFLKRISADYVYLLMPWAAQDKSGLVPLRLTNSRKLRVVRKNVTESHKSQSRWTTVAAAASKKRWREGGGL